MEGRRRTRDVPVAGTVEEILGMSAYMDLGALNHLTGEGDVVSAAALFVESASIPALGARFKELPIVESATVKANAVASFLDKIAGLIIVTAGVLTGFAVIIAVGVVYNSARISCSSSQLRAWSGCASRAAYSNVT
jgi:putative ABC transport system permease protein